MFGETLPTSYSSSGLLCINVWPVQDYVTSLQNVLITDFHVPDDSQHDVIQEILWLDSDLSDKEKIQQLKKLHLQLAHASKD